MIQVAVGVVADGRGRILISRRPDHVHQGGLWEFPGGKVEPGETVQAALERELFEELGIRPHYARRLLRVPHDYGDKQVLLDVWRVERFSGTPQAREGQPFRWVPAPELIHYSFPVANRPIMRAVSLPDRYLITPDPTELGGEIAFLRQLERRMAAGIQLVQLRAHRLEKGAYQRLVEQAAVLARAHGAQLLLNAGPALARELGVGLHLTSARLRTLCERPLAEDSLVAASCHNARELALAARLGLDFAVLGPVAATASHPGKPGLGLECFAELIRDCPLPVYALGGMDQDWLVPVREARGQGIAAIRGLWAPR